MNILNEFAKEVSFLSEDKKYYLDQKEKKAIAQLYILFPLYFMHIYMYK